MNFHIIFCMKKSLDIIDKILKNLTSTPWVYQMKDKGGKVIYVWKSVNLKSRVSSYFRDMGSLTLAKKQMVGKIENIEIILCQTEVEALVLETNLIKHLTPKYNILMKDDKNLAYIKITKNPIPEIFRTRQKIKDGGVYFGPYTQGSNVYESIRELKRIFKVRNCKMKFAEKSSQSKEVIIIDKAGKTPPCMDYYIWLCPAPCLLEGSKIWEHSDNVERMKKFLQGEQSWLLDEMRMKMQDHAKKLEFEEAQKIKILIDSIGVLSEKQIARDVIPWNHDIFIVLEKYEKYHIGLMQIRNSQIIWVFRHTIVSPIETRDEVVSQFLARQYIVDIWTESWELLEFPDSLITIEEITDPILSDFLREQKIEIIHPTIGARKELLDFTLNQVREYAYKSELATLEQNTLTRTHMANILERLGYKVPKKGEIIFECYDISHTHGQFTYASRVLLSNGKPDTSRYKKYKIKSLQAGDIDDYASHKEVMMRRIIEWIELQNLPHLIIIDGGKWQLSSAISGIDLGIKNYEFQSEQILPTERQDIPQRNEIPICSIAKREEEIFIPGDKHPILFEKWSPELMVLQKARDESHRFSITANRSARMKSMKKNILEELPGFGPVTRKKLLKLAGNIDEIKNLSLLDLQSVCTKVQIETLKDHGII